MNAAVQVVVKECAKSDSDVVKKNAQHKKINGMKMPIIQSPLVFRKHWDSNSFGYLKSFMDVGSTVQQLTELTETGGDLF